MTRHRTFSSEGCADAMVAASYEDGPAEGSPEDNANASLLEEVQQLRAALECYSKEQAILRAALKPLANLAAGRSTLPGDWNVSVPLSLLRAAQHAHG